MGIIRHNAVNYEKIATMKLKHRTPFPTPMNHSNQNAILVESSTKLRTADTELMRRMTLGRNDTSSPYPQTKLANNQSPLLKSSQKKLRTLRFRFGETVDPRAYTMEGPPQIGMKKTSSQNAMRNQPRTGNVAGM